MLDELNKEVVSIDDVDMDALSLYDPHASSEIIPRFVVNFTIGESEQKTSFVVRRVTTDDILFELPDEMTMFLQNEVPRGAPPPKEDEPLTDHELEIRRVMHEFNVSAVRLGLVAPSLTTEQITALPITLLRELSDAITGNTDEPEDETEPSEEE